MINRLEHFMEGHRIDVYREGVLGRLIPTFDNIWEEAELEQERYWEELTSEPSDGSVDMGDLTETATDHGQGYAVDLLFLRRQTINNATAGLYHLWEKSVKVFLKRAILDEIGGMSEISQAKRVSMIALEYDKLDRMDFKAMVKRMVRHHFDFKAMTYFDRIDELRLFANCAKHDKGKSFIDLLARRPDLFDINEATGEVNPSVDKLEAGLNDFSQFADAVKQFWQEFELTDLNEGE